MATRVAVIVDGAYLDKEMQEFRKCAAKGEIRASHIKAIAQACLSKRGNEELFRIYYYHCPPYEGSQPRPFRTDSHRDFAATKVASYQRRFQNDIRLSPLFAYRRGVLRWRGWVCRADEIEDPDAPARELRWRPDLQQKQVDIKIGLDIAWLASKSIVDVVCIISGDTDFVPAMKFARREGVQIRIASFSHVPGPPHNNLREHSDGIISLDLKKIIESCH